MRMQRLWQHLLFLLIYGAILPWSSEAVGEGKPRVNKAGLQLTDAALECLRKARSALATAGTEPFPTRSWGPNIESYLLPSIICYDPIGQLGTSCWCTQCNAEMERRPKESGWVSTPLRLFGSTRPYALFSYNYRCPNKECKVKWTIAHRCKLSRLARAFLPFVLNDRFGVATEVISSVREAVISGTSFEQCTRHLAKTYDDAVEAALHKYDLWVARNPLFRGARDSPLIESIRRVPSDDTLRRMFFDTYWSDEEFYRAQMAMLPATRLSGDHTYTLTHFITWMQLTYFARFAIAFVCHCVCLPSHAPKARKKIFYERLKVKVG